MALTEDQKKAFAEVRRMLYVRLKPFSFTEEMLDDKSCFQVVTLLFLMVGHTNYLSTMTCTCRTMEELFGDAFYDRVEKPDNIVREGHESKPLIN
jgi:hypothetical protein